MILDNFFLFSNLILLIRGDQNYQLQQSWILRDLLTPGFLSYTYLGRSINDWDQNGSCDFIGFNLKIDLIKDLMSNPIPLMKSIININGNSLDNIPVISQSSCHIFILDELDNLSQIKKSMIINRFYDKLRIILFTKNREIVDDPNLYDWTLYKPMIILQYDQLVSKWHLHLRCPSRNAIKSYLKRINLWTVNQKFMIPKIDIGDCPSAVAGHFLKIGFVRSIPGSTLDSDGNPWGGDINVIKLWSKKLNFKYNFTNAGTWGTYYIKQNKTTGMIKMIADGTLDLGITQPARSYARHLAIQYMDVISVGSLKFVCFPPLPLPPYRNIIIPFTGNVWLGVAISWLAVSITIVMIQRVHYHTSEIDETGRRRKPASSLLCFLLIFAAMTGESIIHWTDKWKSSLSMRIITIIWFLIGLLVVQSYSCNLRAILIKIEYEKPLDTFKQLADKEINVYFPADSAYETMFKISPLPQHQRIVQLAKERETAFPRGTHLDKFKEMRENKGCKYNIFFGNTRNSLRPEDKYLRPIKENLYILFAGYFNQLHNTPWIGEFNNLIARFRDMGLMDKFYEEASIQLIQSSKDNVIRPLEISHLQTAFFTLIFGLATSMIIWIIEIIFMKRYNEQSIDNK